LLVLHATMKELGKASLEWDLDFTECTLPCRERVVNYGPLVLMFYLYALYYQLISRISASSITRLFLPILSHVFVSFQLLAQVNHVDI
jgi:hypothetical protein